MNRPARSFSTYLAVIAACSFAPTASAVFIGNIQGGADFPAGAASFADEIASSDLVIVAGEPTDPHRDATNALGVPDYAGVNNCTGGPGCSFVSLGDGGSITLRFLDNALTGSGNADPDLFIFEVGPDVEDTFVDVSTDGLVWTSVGAVGGSFATVDIDAFGFGPGTLITWVRLTDDPDLDGQAGITVGADIDAVGAISTQLIPEPSALVLMGLGLLGWACSRRRLPGIAIAAR